MRLNYAFALALVALTVPATAQVLFYEPFNNSGGWIFGPATEWQIGQATAGGNGSGYGFPDPGSDAQGIPSGGVAGVVIGGDAAQVLHPYDYITSPIIDTTVLTTVYLSYQRWLNSDYDPFMHNVVEVFDGLSWVPVWGPTGPSPGVTDSAWTPQLFDVTIHSNPLFQVRFGFDITSTGVFSISSWNIDDVTIFDAQPPYPGTQGSDLVLATGVNGTATSGIGNWTKTATALDVINLVLSSPMGTYDYQPYVILAQPFLTGVPPIPTIPGLVWIDLTQPYAVLVNISPFLTKVLDPGGSPYSLIMPPGFAGQSILFQAACPTPALSVTDGYEIQVQ